MATVSVVIPTYNRAHLLGRAITSVLAQTFTDWEIVVVDDASTDATRELVEGFGDSRIRLLRHETNRGGSAARNTGIDAASGDFIAFLDSDDEWRPTRLETTVAPLLESPAEWDGVCCGFERVINGRTIVTKPSPGSDVFTRVLQRYYLNGGSSFIGKRDTIAAMGGFDANLPRHQDVDFLLQFAMRYRVKVLSEPLVIKHHTANPSAAKLMTTKAIFLERYASHLRALPLLARRRTMASHWLDLSRAHFAERAWRPGLYYLGKGLWQYPFQRPGRWIMLADSTLGLKLAPWVSSKRQPAAPARGVPQPLAASGPQDRENE